MGEFSRLDSPVKDPQALLEDPLESPTDRIYLESEHLDRTRLYVARDDSKEERLPRLSVCVWVAVYLCECRVRNVEWVCNPFCVSQVYRHLRPSAQTQRMERVFNPFHVSQVYRHLRLSAQTRRMELIVNPFYAMICTPMRGALP